MVFRKSNIEFYLYLDADGTTRRYARSLRKKQTRAEKKLWNFLKGRRCAGLKFRRQHPIHYYVADFYCHEQRLIIEVDGEIHSVLSVIEHDKNRTAELERYGIRTLRFSNDQVMNKTEEIISEIIEFVTKHPIT